MESDEDSDDADRDSPARPATRQLPRADSPRDKSSGGRRSWSHVKEQIKHGNFAGQGAAWTQPIPVPTSDVPISRNASRHTSFTRIGPMLDAQDPPGKSSADIRSSSLRNSFRSTERASGRFDPGSMRNLELEDEDTDEEEYEEAEEEEEQAPAVRISLMSLLMDDEDENEGKDGLAYMMEAEDEEEEEEEGGEYLSCCVCMVRHKGSAFMPCGHSFCRLCSREMWVEERGSNCPLCNNYILEILDIF